MYDAMYDAIYDALYDAMYDATKGVQCMMQDMMQYMMQCMMQCMMQYMMHYMMQCMMQRRGCNVWCKIWCKCNIWCTIMMHMYWCGSMITHHVISITNDNMQNMSRHQDTTWNLSGVTWYHANLIMHFHLSVCYQCKRATSFRRLFVRERQPIHRMVVSTEKHPHLHLCRLLTIKYIPSDHSDHSNQKATSKKHGDFL